MSKKTKAPPAKPPSRPKAKHVESSAQSLRILVASGVNLDLLGQRENEHYGHATLQDMEEQLRAQILPVGITIDLSFFQTNEETKYLDILMQGWDGAVLNPGAWTHTSLALADHLAAIKLRFVEVHVSKVMAREQVRQHSFIAPLALGCVSGFGIDSYRIGLLGLLGMITR